MATAMGQWQWALRVTPVLGLIAIVLIYFIQEPARGEHEGSHSQSTSYKQDLTRKLTFSLEEFQSKRIMSSLFAQIQL